MSCVVMCSLHILFLQVAMKTKDQTFTSLSIRACYVPLLMKPGRCPSTQAAEPSPSQAAKLSLKFVKNCSSKFQSFLYSASVSCGSLARTNSAFRFASLARAELFPADDFLQGP